MEKKLDTARRERTEARDTSFQITPKGFVKASQGVQRMLSIVSFRSDALRTLARDPDMSWTALELSYEYRQDSMADEDYLRALKSLERDGYVTRTN